MPCRAVYSVAINPYYHCHTVWKSFQVVFLQCLNHPQQSISDLFTDTINLGVGSSPRLLDTMQENNFLDLLQTKALVSKKSLWKALWADGMSPQ